MHTPDPGCRSLFKWGTKIERLRVSKKGEISMGKKFLSWLPALFGWLTLAVVVWLLGGFCRMLKDADPSLSAVEILRHLAPGLLYASGIGTALARYTRFRWGVIFGISSAGILLLIVPWLYFALCFAFLMHFIGIPESYALGIFSILGAPIAYCVTRWIILRNAPNEEMPLPQETGNTETA